MMQCCAVQSSYIHAVQWGSCASHSHMRFSACTSTWVALPLWKPVLGWGARSPAQPDPSFSCQDPLLSPQTVLHLEEFAASRECEILQPKSKSSPSASPAQSLSPGPRFRFSYAIQLFFPSLSDHKHYTTERPRVSSTETSKETSTTTTTGDKNCGFVVLHLAAPADFQGIRW